MVIEKDNLINYLHEISRQLTLTGEISIEDLKNLLLICFYILIDEEDSKLIKSYVIIILKEIIEIENKIKNCDCSSKELKDFLSELIHNRILYNIVYNNKE